MEWSRGKKTALAVLIFVTLATVGAALLFPKKKKIVLRDPTTLPHVDRAFPNVTSSVPLAEYETNELMRQYQGALDRDPTAAGTLQLVYFRDQLNSIAVQITEKSGRIDQGMIWDIQNRFPNLPDTSPPLLLTFQSQMRHEPLAPGGNAVDNVVRKNYEGAPVVVRATRLKDPFWDDFGSGGIRQRTGTSESEVEFTETLVYSTCTGPHPGRDENAEGSHPPCPKEKHLKGDDVTYEDKVSFALDGDNGWKDRYGRHWFGDELREVESK